MTDKLQGKGTQGDFVLQGQELATSEGFGNVSKIWYKKTLSYDQGLEAVAAQKREREDLEATLSEMTPSRDAEGIVCFEHQDGRSFRPTEYCWTKICSWLDIPTALPMWFVNPATTSNGKVKYKKDTEVDRQLFYNVLKVQAGRQDQKKKFRWRTYTDGTLRAMMSDQYDYVDNEWYLEQLKVLIPGGRLSHWKGDCDTIYGNVLIPDTIREDNDGDYGGMFSLSNCEIGKRIFSQEPSLFRAICMNGCIWDRERGHGIRQKHRGIDLAELRKRMADNIHKQIPLLPELVAHFLSLRGNEYLFKNDETLALLAQVALQEKLTIGSKASQLGKLVDEYSSHESGNRNLFGIINAVTRVAQLGTNEDWVKLDQVGGKLAAYSPKDFSVLRTKAQSLTDKDLAKAYGLA